MRRIMFRVNFIQPKRQMKTGSKVWINTALRPYLNTEVSPVYVVPQEEVACVGRRTSHFKQLHQVKKLAVDVSTHWGHTQSSARIKKHSVVQRGTKVFGSVGTKRVAFPVHTSQLHKSLMIHHRTAFRWEKDCGRMLPLYNSEWDSSYKPVWNMGHFKICE